MDTPPTTQLVSRKVSKRPGNLFAKQPRQRTVTNDVRQRPITRNSNTANIRQVTCPLLHKTGCDWCGKTLTGRRKRWCSTKCSKEFKNNHRWTSAKAAAKAKVAAWLCANCGEYTTKPEVDHIVPCRNRHNQWGCWHHADNLRVLCHKCHVTKTNTDRKNGWK